jgi:hypothetical protein
MRWASWPSKASKGIIIVIVLSAPVRASHVGILVLVARIVIVIIIVIIIIIIGVIVVIVIVVVVVGGSTWGMIVGGLVGCVLTIFVARIHLLGSPAAARGIAGRVCCIHHTISTFLLSATPRFQSLLTLMLLLGLSRGFPFGGREGSRQVAGRAGRITTRVD